jgi:hypothetical protein
LPTPTPGPSEDEGEEEEEDEENPDSEDGNKAAAELVEEENPAGGEEVSQVEIDDEPGMWEEDFKLHPDSKPYGGLYF